MDLTSQLKSLHSRPAPNAVAIRRQSTSAGDDQVGADLAEFAVPTRGRLVFPGAFNPFHRGHREMARIAEESSGQPVEFEISIENVDKAAVDHHEIARRLRQFPAGTTIWLTSAPTFVQKSQVFLAATFIVGVDTIKRIIDPKYYAHDPVQLGRGLRRLAEAQAKFLVFGRTHHGGFQSLPEIDVPHELRNLCRTVSEQEFREDISSSNLRDAEYY